MLVVPLESLAYELRDTFIVLKGLQELPYEIQSTIVSQLDGDYELLRALQRVSRTTKQAIMPLLHRTLSLPGKDVTSIDWYDFIEVLPVIAQECRWPTIRPGILQQHFPILKWSTLLPRIVKHLARLQVAHVTLGADFDASNLLQSLHNLPTLSVLFINLRKVPSFALEPLHEIPRQKGSPLYLKGRSLSRCLFLKGISKTDLQTLGQTSSLLDISLRVLHLKSVAGIWHSSMSLSWLRSLLIDTCPDMALSNLFDIIRECASTLEHLVHRMRISENIQTSSDAEFEVVHLPKLSKLSFETIGEADDASDVANEALKFLTHIEAPALEVLGLGDLPLIVPSDIISTIIQHHFNDDMIVYTRPLDALPEEDEEEENENPLSLENLFAQDRLCILSHAKYEKRFDEKL